MDEDIEITIENGYVLEFFVQPGGYRKTYVYFERSKKNVLKSIKNEMLDLDALIYGQKTTIKVYQNHNEIYSSKILPFIKYKLHKQYIMEFKTLNNENDYSSCDIYINNKKVDIIDDCDTETILIEWMKDNYSINFDMENIKVIIDDELINSIPDIGIISKKGFPNIISDNNLDNDDDDKYEYAEGLNDLG